jgi:hypothetical protein
MKLTTPVQLVPRSRKRGSTLHSSTRLHGVVFNNLSIGTTLIFIFNQIKLWIQEANQNKEFMQIQAKKFHFMMDMWFRNRQDEHSVHSSVLRHLPFDAQVCWRKKYLGRSSVHRNKQFSPLVYMSSALEPLPACNKHPNLETVGWVLCSNAPDINWLCRAENQRDYWHAIRHYLANIMTEIKFDA